MRFFGAWQGINKSHDKPHTEIPASLPLLMTVQLART